MKIYDVTYWQEGPGRSDYYVARVVAKSKRDAIDHVHRSQCVYKVHQDETHAKRVRKVLKPYTIKEWKKN